MPDRPPPLPRARNRLYRVVLGGVSVAFPDGQEAGFVMLPISLLNHPKLTDCDIRVLLTLDLMGWREGVRDGVIRASNKEIADKAGKKVTAICDSIRRLKEIQPPLIEVSMLTTNTRDAIKIVYDRFGGVIGFPTTPYRISDNHTPDYQGGCRISDNQVIGFPTTPPIDIKEIDLVAPVVEVIGFPTTTTQINIQASPPHLTLAELIAWLPGITDDSGVLAQLRRLCPMWFDWLTRRCPRHAGSAAEWIQDAILASSEAKDIATYARKLLRLWAGAGGRPEVELAPRPLPMPDETDIPVSRPSPNGPASFPARQTKAQRNAEANAARRASVARLFAPKESPDEPR